MTIDCVQEGPGGVEIDVEVGVEVGGDGGEVPLERLEDEIASLAAHLAAETCRFLALVADYDRREGYLTWGCRSCAQWLSYRCGLSLAAAREQVRVARALEDLPLVAGRFARGELSYSKVRALTRVATTQSEADLVGLASEMTAAQLDRMVGLWRRHLDPDTELARAAAAHARRFLELRHDQDGTVVIRGRLPAEDGALLVAALDGAAADLPAAHSRDPSEAAAVADAGNTPAGVSRADALVAVARRSLQAGDAGPAAPPVEVVVHVEGATLAGDDREGRCHLEQGPPVPGETARRLACDSTRVDLHRGPDGSLTGVGRRSRTIPPWLRRLLFERDEGCCRFPGCGARRFLHAHHIVHWARGGPTDLANLVLLCGYHHRLVHEGGYAVRVVDADTPGDPPGFTFTRPDGTPIPDHPPPDTPAGVPHPPLDTPAGAHHPPGFDTPAGARDGHPTGPPGRREPWPRRWPDPWPDPWGLAARSYGDPIDWDLTLTALSAWPLTWRN